jgi:predicted outer membrane repeat protein
MRGIEFDTSGWTLRESSNERSVWTNVDGDVLSLNRIDNPDEPLPPLSDLQAVRAFCRNLAEKSGGLISADIVRIGNSQAIQLIYKREHLPAYAYTGMIIIPCGDQRFVLVVASTERGTTGVREAIVTDELLRDGELEIERFDQDAPDGSTGRVKGWFKDPYDSSYAGKALCSAADDEKHDARFPNHPLSKVRATLRHLQKTLRVAEGR